MDPSSHEQAPAPTPSLTHPLPPLARQTALGTVYHSVERPGLTSVFGTSVPPSGLSGQLRRLAYRWPEDQMRHWLTLMLADRVDVGESLLSDLARGHVPNLWAEMGLRTEWRHRRWRLLAQAALVAVLAGWLWRRRRRPALAWRP